MVSTHKTPDDVPLRVGDVLYGFCNGYFGRDSYEPKRVEAIGTDWVVARSLDTHASPRFADDIRPDDLTPHRTPDPEDPYRP